MDLNILVDRQKEEYKAQKQPVGCAFDSRPIALEQVCQEQKSSYEQQESRRKIGGDVPFPIEIEILEYEGGQQGSFRQRRFQNKAQDICTEKEEGNYRYEPYNMPPRYENPAAYATVRKDFIWWNRSFCDFIWYSI